MTEQMRDDLIRLSDEVFDHPEFGFCEKVSSATQAAFLRQEGFEVEENVADTITGYKAVYGSGHPVIAFLGEFDALYGLGQETDVCEKRPDGREMGHGCGHHLLGTGCIGAGLLVRDHLKETGCPGTVIVYGCPGEESGSGKAYMARDGAFDGVDIAFSWHPSNYHMIATGSSQSCIQCFFRFHGIASHAAQAPEQGRSALDAVELTDIGVNYLREHMRSTDRVHYAITDTGGHSPNVVQAEAEVKYLIRSATNPECRALYERVCRIAQGAALMTDTTLEICFDEGLSNTIPNFALEEVLAESFRRIGPPEYTEDDRAYASRFRATFGEISRGDLPYIVADKEALAENIAASPVCDIYLETQHSDICEMGSTDVGDVSWVVPTTTLNVACYSYGANAHSWQWVAQGKSGLAHKGMLRAAEILADAAVTLLKEPERIDQAKKEFEHRLGGTHYICPIPPDVHPHVL